MAAKAAQPAVISISGTQLRCASLPSLGPTSEPVALFVAKLIKVTQVMVSASPTLPSQERSSQQLLERKPYPHFKVVVLDDQVNTFEHVVDCLVRYVPAMTPDLAWELAHTIDGQGSAVVWSGPQEQAELIHQQLGAEGLTMAPLEPA